jgi:hypothetical protein
MVIAAVATALVGGGAVTVEAFVSKQVQSNHEVTAYLWWALGALCVRTLTFPYKLDCSWNLAEDQGGASESQ